jgi:aspartate/methionine/tyrosine aminotransferase
MVERFSSRRKLLVQALKAVPGIRFVLPYGAFYLFMNVSGTGLDGTLFASRLLEESGVAVVPGEGFDHQFANYVRISYATSEEEIVRGVKRVGEFVKRLGELQED